MPRERRRTSEPGPGAIPARSCYLSGPRVSASRMPDNRVAVRQRSTTRRTESFVQDQDCQEVGPTNRSRRRRDQVLFLPARFVVRAGLEFERGLGRRVQPINGGEPGSTGLRECGCGVPRLVSRPRKKPTKT